MSVTDDSTTIGESNIITDKIIKRSFYVFSKIAELSELKFSWLTFDSIDLEKYDGIGVVGYDYALYKDTFNFYSDLNELEYRNKVIDIFYNKFPSRFIYENFEEEVLSTIEKQTIDEKKERSLNKRLKAQKKAAERAKIRNEVIASIESKLTPLELSFITFK